MSWCAGEIDLQRALGDWRPVLAVAQMAEPKMRVKHASVDESGSAFGINAMTGT